MGLMTPARRRARHVASKSSGLSSMIRTGAGPALIVRFLLWDGGGPPATHQDPAPPLKLYKRLGGASSFVRSRLCRSAYPKQADGHFRSVWTVLARKLNWD